jgi:hypothetical protein
VAITLAVYFSGSRTGAVFIICLAALDALADRWLGDRPRFRVALLAAATIVAAIVFPYLARFAAIALNYVFGADIEAEALFAALARPDEHGNTRLLHPTSDIERWETIVGGLRLWVDRPVLGAGIGAYVQWLLATGQRGQGIHSIYVWFLSEMGVVGLAALLALGTRVVFWAWRMMAVPAAAPWAFTTLGILALMAIGGLVQDFFFQRLFWFALGFSGAMAAAAANETSDARLFLAAVVTVAIIVFCLAL